MFFQAADFFLSYTCLPSPGEYSEEDLKGYWRDAMAVAGAPSDAKKDVGNSASSDDRNIAR